MSAADPALDFVVRRDDLHQCRFIPAAGPEELELDPGQLVLSVEKFGFTANNITYAVFGDAMQYWTFFPAPDGWGRLPVWGFAEVVRSAHDGIGEGERVYGYLPMSTHLVLQPERVAAAGFVDGSPHRAALPGAYQQYTRLAGDATHDPRHEDELALLQPLFVTSFLIEDFLAENELFGGRTVLLASASSKTALGTAFLLSQNRPSDCRVVGLTSERNVKFCKEVGYYDDVVPYPEVEGLPVDATVLVDMAGDGKVLGAVHERFQDDLKHSCLVGATHWDRREPPQDLPGPTPEFFFAPTRIEKRREDWGGDEFAKRYGAARNSFLPSAGGWMEVTLGRGPTAVESTYRDMLDGNVDPKRGHMLSLHG